MPFPALNQKDENLKRTLVKNKNEQKISLWLIKCIKFILVDKTSATKTID